jgi:hypothetical protein
MILVPFRAAKADGTVFVNPESVVRVDPGSHHYNLNTMPTYRTFIAQVNGGGVFVDVAIDEVVRRLRNYEKECQHP